jgi:hypothetical protein
MSDSIRNAYTILHQYWQTVRNLASPPYIKNVNADILAQAIEEAEVFMVSRSFLSWGFLRLMLSSRF